MKIVRYFPVLLLTATYALAAQDYAMHHADVDQSDNLQSKKHDKWKSKTHNVGYPQDELPVPITHCLDRELPVFEDATIFYGAAAEPTLAVNPKNHKNIVAAWQQDRISDSGALELGIAFTFDGGKTWERSLIPTQLCIGGYIDRISDVWLSFSKDGEELYLSSLPFNITQNFNTLDQQGIAMNISLDGGKTWNQRQLLGTSQDAFNAPDSGILYPFDDKPSVTADPNNSNRAYVVRERFDSVFGPTGNHAPTLFNRTLNEGQLWSDFTVIYDPQLDTSFSPLTANSTFNNLIVVLPNSISSSSLRGNLLNFMTLSLTDISDNDYFNISLIRSTDLGATWDTQATIVVPTKAKDPNGAPIVFTGGYTYDGGGNITGGIGTLMRTAEGDVFDVVANPQNGDLYLVFQTTQFRSDFLPQIGLTISRDGGFTWSTPIRINRTPQNSPNPQAFTPAIAITENGDIGILYSDFRKDSKSDPNATKTNTWLDIYKESHHKLEFVQELRLSEHSYIAQNGPVTTSGTMTNGDYSFLVATKARFYAAFTKSHKGPFTPPQLFFTDISNDTHLFIDNNYRQSPYVSVIKHKD